MIVGVVAPREERERGVAECTLMSVLSLLLSKTAAAASFQVGIGLNLNLLTVCACVFAGIGVNVCDSLGCTGVA